MSTLIVEHDKINQEFKLGNNDSFEPRIMRIRVLNNEHVIFSELCDCYFEATCTKAEAIEALELIVAELKTIK